MNILHNMNAIKANSQLNSTNNTVNKALERLSSGLKINRAADNVAGLRISETMRNQIKGISQAARNTIDGISMIQVADGSMDEISNILNRIRDLSVTAATETHTLEDRQNIQTEIDELLLEIDNLSNHTEFNKIPLLNGLYGNNSSNNNISLDKIVQYMTPTNGTTDKYTFNGKDYAAGVIDFSNLTTVSQIQQLDGQGFKYTCCTCNKVYSIKFVNGDPDTSRLNANNPVMEVDIRGIQNGVDLVEKIKSTAYNEPNFEYNPENNQLPPSGGTEFVKHFSQIATENGKLYIYDQRSNQYGQQWPQGDRGTFTSGVYGEAAPNPNADITLQVGPSDGQTLKINLPTVTLKAMKLTNPPLSVLSHLDATDAISRIDSAVDYLNNERTRMGAYQNQLEHIMYNLGNTEENLQASESIIRDADISKEMLLYNQTNILSQANQFMLAQANQRHEASLKGIILNSQA